MLSSSRTSFFLQLFLFKTNKSKRTCAYYSEHRGDCGLLRDSNTRLHPGAQTHLPTAFENIFHPLAPLSGVWELSFLRDGTGAAALEGRSPSHWTTGQVPHALFFFLRFFVMDHFLKSLLNLLQHCFLLCFGFRLPGMWDLRSLTNDQTPALCRRLSLNHWTVREVPPPVHFYG